MTIRKSRCGFTMIELFAVVMLISILIMLLLPAVQSAREMARRTSCSNNLMQVSLALSMYHDAFDQFPVQLSGTDGSLSAAMDNDRRLSFLVAILPFSDQRNIADDIRSALPRSPDELGMMYDEDWWDGSEPAENFAETDAAEPSETPDTWVAGGPEPFVEDYLPWKIDVPLFRCPSDPGIGGGFGRTNYAVCLGDGVLGMDSGPLKESANGSFVVDPMLARQTEAAMRGVFVPRVITRKSDIKDGVSHTILLGELATDLGDRDIRTLPAAGPGADVLRDQPSWARENELIDPERSNFWTADVEKRLENDSSQRRGLRWSDGMPLYTSFNTILSPNREITLSTDRDDTWGILPPSSRHQGGVQVAMADGSVRFISDSIDAGDESEPTVYDGSTNRPGSKSPYGVWGAMGTRASAELLRQ